MIKNGRKKRIDIERGMVLKIVISLERTPAFTEWNLKFCFIGMRNRSIIRLGLTGKHRYNGFELTHRQQKRMRVNGLCRLM